MLEKEEIIKKLKDLLEENDVENPNFETASFLKKGIEEIIEQEVEQDSKKSKLSITITPSGVLNASKIILPKIIEDGLKKIESEKDEQEVQWYEDKNGKKYNLEFYNPKTKMWNVRCLICNSIHEQRRRMDTCEKCWKGTVCLHPRKKENFKNMKI